MESALSHPLQALADLLTMGERLGDLAGRRVLLTWAYHPRALPIAVSRSFLLAATRAGMNVTLARPDGFELPAETMETARAFAEESGGALDVTSDAEAGYENAEIVYAKSWANPEFYGRLAEEAPRREASRHWQVTAERMARTADAAFMHCLPVRRGVVVADEVLDGHHSVVIAQAKNRLWTTMALLTELLVSH
jgi:N-acetylornithine carbamoyltransferase